MQKIENAVNGLWNRGYNCAECTFFILSNEKSFELSPQILKMAKIMGSGYKSGCICGALSGAISFCAIYEKEYNPKTAKKLYEKFVKQFGASCCRKIRKKCKCTKKVVFAVESALEERNPEPH